MRSLTIFIHLILILIVSLHGQNEEVLNLAQWMSENYIEPVSVERLLARYRTSLAKSEKERIIHMIALDPHTNYFERLDVEEWDEVKKFDLTFSKLLSDSIGYIFIPTFISDSLGKEVRRDILSLHASKLILDLRGNGGGLKNATLEVLGLFFPKNKQLLFQGGRKGWEFYYSQNDAPPWDGPLAVLIDGKSASASEIVAGVIQDYDRGWIIGVPTYGKGVVQSRFNFTNGAIARVVTSRCFLPSGRCPQRDYGRYNGVWNAYYKDAFNDSLRRSVTGLPKYTTAHGRVVYNSPQKLDSVLR